jgi:hypothetical protein
MTCYEYRHGTMERRWRRAMMKPKFRDRVYGPRGGQYSVAILVIKKKRSTRTGFSRVTRSLSPSSGTDSPTRSAERGYAHVLENNMYMEVNRASLTDDPSQNLVVPVVTKLLHNHY